jgi:hypothetical protein
MNDATFQEQSGASFKVPVGEEVEDEDEEEFNKFNQTN